MKSLTTLAAAGIVVASGALMAAPANAAPFDVSGTFKFEIYNYNPVANKQTNSEATPAKFNGIADDVLNSTNNVGENITFDFVEWTGSLNFDADPSDDASVTPDDSGTGGVVVSNILGITTVADFFASAAGAGTFGTDAGDGLSSAIDGKTLSAGGGPSGDGGVSSGFETATLFRITANTMNLNIADMSQITKIRHDDGVTLRDGAGSTPVAFKGPNSLNVLDNLGGSLSGDTFELYYAAANGDPSILQVQAVPLPAAAWLLLGVSGALVGAKRRSARKAA